MPDEVEVRTEGQKRTRWVDSDEVGGSGGITNGAPNNTIPLSNGTNLIDSKITWDGSAGVGGILSPAVGENGVFELLVTGVGAQLQLRAASGDASHVGGEVSIMSGDSAGQSGGQIQIIAGNDSDSGDGGNIVIRSGDANAVGGGNSGDISITVGQITADSNGGNINISAGSGKTGGGSIVLQAGNRTVSGSHGTVQIYSADSNNSIELNNSGLFVTAPVLSISEVAKLEPQAFASLPASPEEGMMAWVNDSNTATWGANIAGGGANKVLAVYNGTNWTVAGK